MCRVTGDSILRDLSAATEERQKKKEKRSTRCYAVLVSYLRHAFQNSRAVPTIRPEQRTLVNVRLVHANLRRCTYLWPSSSHGRLGSALKKKKEKKKKERKEEKGERSEWKKFKCGRNESYITRSRQSKAIKCYPYSSIT